MTGKMFFSTQEFDKQWERMGLDDEARQQLENEIMENPKAGTVIKGTGGLRILKRAFSSVS